MNTDYVHGYAERESGRLEDQANCLNNILHNDTVFPKGSLVLEAGCGVGAQTKIIALRNFNSKFISMDISPDSITKAEALIKSMNISNVEFRVGDIFNLRFPDEYFDHVFVCFVLEHLPHPVDALKSLKRVLKKGGTITLIEGDHGSAYFYPDSPCARKVIDAQVELQSKSGGNALIGRRLYPILNEAGFTKCHITPKTVYVDSSRPDLVEGFTRKTFTAMIEGIRKKAIADRIIDEETFDRGVRDLYRTAGADGVFCYTFFKGVALNI